MNGSIRVFDITGKEIARQIISTSYEQIAVETTGIIIVKIFDADDNLMIVKKLHIY